MATDPSFYYAIFKKFQVAAGPGMGGGHNNPEGSDILYGGFCLLSPDSPNGIFGVLGGNAAPALIGQSPLSASNDPNQNPLYVMLKTGLGTPGTVPDQVPVGAQAQVWPVMPSPELDGNISNAKTWLSFNAGSPKLIDVFATWIINGKTNDSPKTAPLTYAALSKTPPAPFPLAKVDNMPILLVCSRPGDNGQRLGDGATPDVPPDPIPQFFWATSQIFLTNHAGLTVKPKVLPSGAEYYVAAIVGNSGDTQAGHTTFGPATIAINVLADAQPFNTYLDVGTPLPSLGNLAAQDPDPVYEQYFLRPGTYDVAGFRFNVDAVIAGLKAEIIKAKIDLGGLSADAWLNNSHPCIKVRIISGEPPNIYTPKGNAPLTLASNPHDDRHIAQRNLAPFLLKGMKVAKKSDKIVAWKNFMIAQAAPGGSNMLALQHSLPSDAFRLYLAMPTRTYARYVAAKGRKGRGGTQGWQVVRKVSAKPFPDAVILRQTGRKARLEVAAHKREPILGLSLGIEWDPAKIKKTTRLSDVSMVHARHDGTIAGGFTLQLTKARQTRAPAKRRRR